MYLFNSTISPYSFYSTHPIKGFFAATYAGGVVGIWFLCILRQLLFFPTQDLSSWEVYEAPKSRTPG